jgi:hypothetical protein
MNIKQFKKYLLLYGAEVENWPEEIRAVGLKLLENSSELQALVAEQSHFEKVLETRKYEEPNDDLAQGIISASLRQRKKGSFSLGAFFSDSIAELSLPKPAFIAVSILVIGLAIGFSDPFGSESTEQEQMDLQEFLYVEGELL